MYFLPFEVRDFVIYFQFKKNIFFSLQHLFEIYFGRHLHIAV